MARTEPFSFAASEADPNLRAALDSLDAALWSLERGSGVVRIWAPLHGVLAPLATLSSLEDFLRLVPDVQRGMLRATLDACMRDRRGFEISVQLNLPAGPIEVALNGRHTPCGAAGHLDLLHEDDHAHVQLLRGDALLNCVQRMAGVGLWEIDLISGFHHWDRQVFEIYGLDADGPQLTVEEAISYYTPRARELLEPALADCIQHGKPFIVENELRRADGRVIWVRSAGQRIELAGQPVAVVGTFQDISESMQTRQRLEHRLRLANHAGHAAFWERDLRTGQGQWDARMFELFGFDPTGPVPSFEQASARFIDGDRERARAIWTESLRSGGIAETFYRIRHDDGRIVALRSVWEVELDTDGVPMHAVGLVTDNTPGYQLAMESQALAEQLDLAANIGGVGIWRLDAATNIITANARAYELYGLDPNQTWTLDAAIHGVLPEDRSLVERARDASFNTDEVVLVEYRVSLADGNIRHLQTRSRSQRDAAGRLLSVIGVASDITEIRVALETEQSINQRLQLAASSSGIGFWEFDPATGIFDNDAQVMRIWGLGERQMQISKARMDEQVEPEDLGRYNALLDAVVQDGQTRGLVYRIRRADGVSRLLRLNASAVRDPAGTVIKLVGTERDITYERSIELELRSALDRLSLATQTARIGIFEHNVDRRETWWDAQMFDLYGEPRASGRMPDEIWRTAVDAGERQAARTLLGSAQADQQLTREFTIRRADGQERSIASRGIVSRNAQGERIVVGVNWDVTDMAQAERDRREREIAVRESQAKSEFLSRMSHELRTPLNAILGFSQLLLHDPAQDLSLPQRNHLQSIESAGWHLLEMINEVLELSRIDSSQGTVQCAAVELGAIVREIGTLLEPMAQKAGVSIELPLLIGAGWYVHADATRLKQVLSNLISNAIKYNRAGGQVRVEIGQDEAQIRLAVRDTGRGMSADQQRRLFRPFDRLGMETSGIEGVGIGLVITRKLAELMDAQLDVQSTEGEGSCFTLSLRRVPAPEAVPAQTRSVSESSVQSARARGKVLYIEDNALNRAVFEGLLMSRPNVALCCAATGGEGVRAALADPPNLIVVDLHLPDMDGYGVLEALRREPVLQGVPIVTLTASAMAEDRDRALAAGFADFWTKPLSLDGLTARLDELLIGEQ
ncbi:PAS domain-containing protein [Piscinibacterium candidicorallinum]|uniref:histidine kinase n=1 Tax=Piscinibacterium candidicorallinum TaxID=1793872 RepID=A0ABV7H4J2_9BURK